MNQYHVSFYWWRLGSILCQFLELRDRPDAPRTTVHNVKRWLHNRKNPIDEDEVNFLDMKDLISLSRVQKSPFRRLFDRFIVIPFVRTLCRQPEKDKTLLKYQTTTVLHNEPDFLIPIFVFILAVCMLIAPLWILSSISEPREKLVIMTALLLALLIVLSWGTRARPFEILAVTAGYVPKAVPCFLWLMTDYCFIATQLF